MPPLLLGEVTVSPGDLILGDGDGVVVIPLMSLSPTIEQASERVAAEARVIERLRSGERTLDIYGWV